MLLLEGKKVYLEDNEEMERNFEEFFFLSIFRSFRDSTLDFSIMFNFTSILVAYLFAIQFYHI